MSASAWADYLDARLRLVHEWRDEGHSPIATAERLTTDAARVLQLEQTPTEPPIPGCSRHLVAIWRDRCERLEAMLAESGPATPRSPGLSGFFPKA